MKAVIIRSCLRCPKVDWDSLDNAGWRCMGVPRDRQMGRLSEGTPIPGWCPLPDVELAQRAEG